MTDESNFNTRGRRLKMSGLVGLTAATVMVNLFYWGGIFGSGFALNALVNLSLPQYNILAALIPDDLSQTRWAVELAIGVVLLQWASIFGLLAYVCLTVFRKH